MLRTVEKIVPGLTKEKGGEAWHTSEILCHCLCASSSDLIR